MARHLTRHPIHGSLPRFVDPVEQDQKPIVSTVDVPERIPLTPAQRVTLMARVILTTGLLLSMALLALAWILPFKTDHDPSAYDTAAYFAFFTRVYQFQLGIACAVLAASLLMMRCWKRGLLALVLTVATVVPDLWIAREKTPPIAKGAPLRVMTVSMHAALHDANSACEAILDQKPDVVTVLQLTPSFAQQIQTRLADAYPYRVVEPSEHYDGLAIFSKFPITLDSAPLDEGKRWLRTTLTWNDQPIDFYAIHFAPPQTIEGLRANRWQVGQILTDAADERRPIVLAGDFNFTTMTSQAMALKAAGFTDAHSIAGRDSGETWPTAVAGKLVPAVRIDTVYTRGPLVATSSRVAQRFGSDHLPIVVDLSMTLPKKAATSPATGSVK